MKTETIYQIRHSRNHKKYIFAIKGIANYWKDIKTGRWATIDYGKIVAKFTVKLKTPNNEEIQD